VRHRAVRAHSLVDSCVSRTVVRIVSRVSRVPFARVVTRRVYASRVPFARVACLAVRRRVSRVVHVCRAVSMRDNKLFLLINTHVNNGNSSGHIF
jgi:hypothetical protein